MRKLLRANLVRIRKSKLFWVEIIALTVSGLVLFVNSCYQAEKYEYPLPAIFGESIFSNTILIGIFFAVFCSLFVGTEYDDGTIRNKLMIGRSRPGIYLSNLISCMAAGLVQSAAAVAVVLITGFLMIGKPDMGAGQFFQMSAVLVFLCMSYISIYNLFAMLITSKSHAATVNMLLAFAFLMFAAFMSSRLGEPEMITDYSYIDGVLTTGGQIPNPNYIDGMRRTIYQFLFDFLPGGQSLQVTNAYLQQELLGHTALSCFYSVVISVVTNVAGIILFRRKDIK